MAALGLGGEIQCKKYNTIRYKQDVAGLRRRSQECGGIVRAYLLRSRKHSCSDKLSGNLCATDVRFAPNKLIFLFILATWRVKHQQMATHRSENNLKYAVSYHYSSDYALVKSRIIWRKWMETWCFWISRLSMFDNLGNNMPCPPPPRQIISSGARVIHFNCEFLCKFIFNIWIIPNLMAQKKILFLLCFQGTLYNVHG